MGNSFEDLDLDRLRRRRSEKWRLHPPDVLPAFIAEMDYDLAEPVLATLRSAIDLSDCGYAHPAGLGDGFVRVTIGTSSALLADIVDRMAAAAA
jgi:cysteine-S-conjugate beta-lyase